MMETHTSQLIEKNIAPLTRHSHENKRSAVSAKRESRR